jgi:hypothetical protein
MALKIRLDFDVASNRQGNQTQTLAFGHGRGGCVLSMLGKT